MKVSIKPLTNSVKDPESEMKLLFTRSSSGPVYLEAEDSSGRIWAILRFDSQTGAVERCSGIPEQSGWPIDAIGRLIITDTV